MSLINKQEENSPEFEVIKGGRTISPMNFRKEWMMKQKLI